MKITILGIASLVNESPQSSKETVYHSAFSVKKFYCKGEYQTMGVLTMNTAT